MISMKYPLKTVCLVDADVQVLKGFELLEKYIKEELNCLELELKSSEDDFVLYKATADNREMGQAFGKKFDKAAKAAIENLSSDMIRQYLKTENIEVNGLNITSGMLKVSKDFKEEYQKSTKWAVASSMLSSVMLDTEQTEELKNMGLSREVTNRIQRLRKTSGISIDDQIEIFYQFDDASKTVAQAVCKYSDRVFQQTRMPFINISELQPNQVKIGETEFVNPDDEKDFVKLFIYLAAPKFTPKLAEDFAAHGPSFVNDLKSYVL